MHINNCKMMLLFPPTFHIVRTSLTEFRVYGFLSWDRRRVLGEARPLPSDRVRRRSVTESLDFSSTPRRHLSC